MTGDIKFTGPVDLTVNVSMDSDKDDDSTDGDITFTSTVNGAKTLTLDADGGAADVQGAVGGTTKLTSLTVDGGQVDLKAVATTGNIDIEGTNIDLNGTTYTSDDGDIKFTGPVDLHANVTVDSDKDDDATDGDITFTSTINGAKSLTLDADGGAVDVQGAVGGTTKLTSLTVDGGQVDLKAVATTGKIDIEGTNIDLNGATYTSNDGDIKFTGPVDLTVNVTVDSDKDNDSTDGDITFTSTVDGGKSLTLDADSGAVDVQGAVGGTTKLTSLTVDGGQVDLKAVATTGAIVIEGTNIDLNGATYTSDDGRHQVHRSGGPHCQRERGQRQGRRQHRRRYHVHLDGQRREDADAGCRRRRGGRSGCCGRHDQADEPDGGRWPGRSQGGGDDRCDRHRGHQH